MRRGAVGFYYEIHGILWIRWNRNSEEVGNSVNKLNCYLFYAFYKYWIWGKEEVRRNLYKFYEFDEIETARKVVDESNFYLFYEFYEYWTRGKGRGNYKLLFVLTILRTLDKGEGKGDKNFY